MSLTSTARKHVARLSMSARWAPHRQLSTQHLPDLGAYGYTVASIEGRVRRRRRPRPPGATGRTSRPKSEEDHWAAAGAFDHAKDPKPTKTEANAASVTVLQSRTVVRQADVPAFVASSKRALARLVQAVPSLTAAELRVGGQADSEGNVEVQSHTTWAGEPAMHSLPEDPLLTAWLADMAQFMKQRPEVSSFTQEVIIPER